MSDVEPGSWCKICGITNIDDAQMVAEAGADAYGLVFYPKSPRAVSLKIAAAIAQAVASPLRVGLFVNATQQNIESVLESVELDMLQFQGDEEPEFCASFQLPYLKAIRMRQGIDYESIEQQFRSAWGLLLDAFVAGVPGGTGKQFDLALWPKQSSSRLILAGGLTADNVAESIRQTCPYGVDVSSATELRKGKKNAAETQRFIKEAHSVARQTK
jgi:phosphoribosylanthranilate isomerase